MSLLKEQQKLKAQLDLRAMAYVASFVDEHKNEFQNRGARITALDPLIKNHRLVGLGGKWGKIDPWPHNGATLLDMVSADLAKIERLADTGKRTNAQRLDAFFRQGSELLSEGYRAQLEAVLTEEETVPESDELRIGSDEEPLPAVPSDDDESYSEPVARPRKKITTNSKTSRNSTNPGQSRAPPKDQTEDLESDDASVSKSESEHDHSAPPAMQAYNGRRANDRRPSVNTTASRSPTPGVGGRTAEQEVQSPQSGLATSVHVEPARRSRKRMEREKDIDTEPHRPRKARKTKLRDNAASGKAPASMSPRTRMIEESDMPEQAFQANRSESTAGEDLALTRVNKKNPTKFAPTHRAQSPGDIPTTVGREHGQVNHPSIMQADLEAAIQVVDASVQQAVQVLVPNDNDQPDATIAVEPSRSLTRLYVATLGKQWLRLASVTSSVQDFGIHEPQKSRLTASNLLRALIWHYLAAEILRQESLEDTVHSMLHKSKPHLQPVLRDEGVSFQTVLRRASTAQLEDAAYTDRVLAQCAQDHASKLMIILRQHLNEMDSNTLLQNCRLGFVTALGQLCRQALVLRVRLQVEETRHEICTFGYPAALNGDDMAYDNAAGDKVLLTLVPGVKQLNDDGQDGTIVVKPMVLVCDVEL